VNVLVPVGVIVSVLVLPGLSVVVNVVVFELDVVEGEV